MAEPVNVKTIWNKHKVAIITGVISSIIATIIVQVLIAAPQIGQTLFETIENYVISMASKMDGEFLILIVLTFILSFSLPHYLGNIVSSFFYHKKHEDSYKKRMNNIGVENDNPENKLKYYEKKIRIARLKAILVISFFLVYIIVSIFIPAILHLSFSNTIVIIKPYTDYQTIMLLESDWARMKSKDDYDKIDAIINKIKEENNIQ